MRKVIVISHITLDGVLQAMGGQTKIPVVASRMAAGSLPIPTMFLEQSCVGR